MLSNPTRGYTIFLNSFVVIREKFLLDELGRHTIFTHTIVVTGKKFLLDEHGIEYTLILTNYIENTKQKIYFTFQLASTIKQYMILE